VIAPTGARRLWLVATVCLMLAAGTSTPAAATPPADPPAAVAESTGTAAGSTRAESPTAPATGEDSSVTAGPTGSRANEPLAPDTTRRLDLSAYQALLDEFLSVISKPGEPLETSFDYVALNHQKDCQERLARIRLSFLAVAPSAMDDRTRLAWAIDLYNFLVIQRVTENLYMRRIRGYYGNVAAYVRPLRHSVQEISFSDGSFFDAPAIDIEGVRYSLDEFERHFLFADFDRASKAPPPRTLDLRVHFAMVRGAKSCPPLRLRAYLPDSVDGQLDAAVRTALENPKYLKMDPQNGSLRVSSIFSWYQADFGGQTGIIAFLKRHAPAAVRAQIAKRKPKWVNSYIPWDWSLNQTPD
jgi:hypothetical protein